ncbi:MAG: alkyl sulfatase dimerization domain-containing protein [Nitrososphaeraceae archaeon]
MNTKTVFIISLLSVVVFTSLTVINENMKLISAQTDPQESLTGIPYPDIPHENQDAVEHIKKFTPPKVVKVTDGVYSAIGYGLANIMMLEGTDGIIIIDAGETNEQAEKVLTEFRKITDKPIVAVIYTHNHVDHTEGAGVFVNESREAGIDVDVIAQEDLVANYYNSYGALANQQGKFSLSWAGVFLPKEGEDRVISAGIGPTVEPGETSFVIPNVTFDKKLETEYAGLKLIIGSQPGETPDELYVWVPEKGVLFVGENIYELFPNLYSMRGTSYRDVSLWIDSLDELRTFNASHMVTSHTRPVSGQENVSQVLTNYRDGVAYIYDQTIRQINKGLDPDDLVQVVKLPPYLADNPWLQPRYGQIEWMVKGIYSGEVGWNTGDPTWFNPVNKTERGANIVEGFGGVNETIAKIKQALLDRNESWAAELATYLLYAYPDNEEAKLLKAQAFRTLAWINPTSGARDWYLTDARVLEGKLDESLLNNLWGVEERIMNTPMDILLSLSRYNIDPAKSGNMNMTVGIKINDTADDDERGYTLDIRQAVLEFQEKFPESYDIAIVSDEKSLKQVIAGINTLDNAIENGQIKIEGDVDKLDKFVEVFDTGLKSTSIS